MSGFPNLEEATHLLYRSIIFREILIINITYGISKSPSALRGPLHTLSHVRLEVLQHFIPNNETDFGLEKSTYSCLLLLILQNSL